MFSRNRVFISTLLMVFSALLLFSFYNKADIIRPDFAHVRGDLLTVDELYKAFVNNPAQANKDYGNRVVEVSGTLMSIAGGKAGAQILLIGGEEGIVYCNLDKKRNKNVKKYSVGDKISIRGFCLGYFKDEDEIRMNKCIIVEREIES
ncbi:MAG: hypothetical protein JJU28_23950 [Cyclobacteriaceae bacterium]|nr:hypothetical protein [Cyclobacteriaceae bacterium]